MIFHLVRGIAFSHSENLKSEKKFNMKLELIFSCKTSKTLYFLTNSEKFQKNIHKDTQHKTF